MKYELAKKLKDAGFPQEEKEGHISCGCDDVAIRPDSKLVFDCGNERVYKPTLSELIEAVLETSKDQAKILFGYELEYFDGTWRAQVGWIAHQEYQLGSTPEEAVAKLWLALHS